MKKFIPTEEYYKDDLERLRNRVNKCDIDILDSLYFFMNEADTYPSGLPEIVTTNIENEIKTFKKYCRTEKRFH